jgi:hypothetical protein
LKGGDGMNALQGMEKYDELRNIATLVKKCKSKLKELGELSSGEIAILNEIEQGYLKKVMAIQDQLEGTELV